MSFNSGVVSGWLSKAAHRKWLYQIAMAGVPLLVAYGAVSESVAPLWIALIGSFLVPTLALSHLSPDSDPVE
jgi:hypothetical protein